MLALVSCRTLHAPDYQKARSLRVDLLFEVCDVDGLLWLDGKTVLVKRHFVRFAVGS